MFTICIASVFLFSIITETVQNPTFFNRKRLYNFLIDDSVYFSYREDGMQIGILINDSEYREALVERLSCYDNDLLVNVINGSESFSKDSLILTDIDPLTLDKDLLFKLKPRTIFLSASFPPVLQKMSSIRFLSTAALPIFFPKLL